MLDVRDDIVNGASSSGKSSIADLIRSMRLLADIGDDRVPSFYLEDLAGEHACHLC
jgi:hypothetical protein